MATKAQERKALEQIRKIVDSLGEQSYIATAFEGCLQDADDNIDDDAAYSMKSRWELEKERNAELQNALDIIKEQNNRLTDRAQHAEQEAMDESLARKIINDYRAQIIEKSDELDLASRCMVDMIGKVKIEDQEFVNMAEKVASLKRKIACLKETEERVSKYLN